jgi:hypothetical protein
LEYSIPLIIGSMMEHNPGQLVFFSDVLRKNGKDGIILKILQCNHVKEPF